jgi:hypothetical protein
MAPFFTLGVTSAPHGWTIVLERFGVRRVISNQDEAVVEQYKGLKIPPVQDLTILPWALAFGFELAGRQAVGSLGFTHSP